MNQINHVNQIYLKWFLLYLLMYESNNLGIIYITVLLQEDHIYFDSFSSFVARRYIGIRAYKGIRVYGLQPFFNSDYIHKACM